MKISLKNFESIIDPKILQRGRDYLERGLVTTLEEIEEGQWAAIVEGSEYYELTVMLKDNEIVESLCNCPYDFGPVCKHEASVYLAISQKLGGEDLQKIKGQHGRKKAKRKTVAEKTSEIVAKLTEEEMREIVLDYALNDREFRNVLFARNLIKADKVSKNKKQDYKSIMKDSLRSGMDRHGFISRGNSSRAVRGIEELVYEANNLLEQRKPECAMPIYQAAIEVTVPALQYADDSYGNLGWVIRLSFEKLHECAESIRNETDRKIFFEYSLLAAKNQIYDGWSDWQWEWLKIASKLANAFEEKESIFQEIDEMVSGSQQKGLHSDKYDRENAIALKLDILRKWDKGKVSQFVADNLEHTPIRRFALESAIIARDYETAKQLANAGIKLDTKRGYPGLVHEWLGWLLHIAETEADTQAIRTYSKELFLQGHNEFKYYDKLKNTYSEKEWPNETDKLIQELIQSRRCHVHTLAEIFVREEKWPKLLTLMKNNLSEHTLDSYQQHLEHRFPQDVIEMQEQVIRKMLEKTANRPTYQDACRRLRRMKKMGAGEKVRALAAELREMYRNRRALLEELREF